MERLDSILYDGDFDAFEIAVVEQFEDETVEHNEWLDLGESGA